MAITVFQYPKCSTCRKALKWLDEHGVAYKSVDIVGAPPSKAQLSRAKGISKLPIGKLFNVSGESYRAGGFKDRLTNMSEADALAALAADGKLIKRPLVLGDDVALVGFDEAAWKAALL